MESRDHLDDLCDAFEHGQETRDLLRERSAKSLEYLNQQASKLRQTTEGIVGKGKAMLSQSCCSSEATTETARGFKRR